MDEELKRLIRDKKIEVKLGKLIRSKDKFGNVIWSFKQIPVYKK